MLDNKERFVIDNYGAKSTFASFLPGISGEMGIPIWCYYVNRGQGITSFGVDNKDHAIMEFFPAHQAYQNVKKQGFRTFVRKDGNYMEPFQMDDNCTQMLIGMNELVISCNDDKNGVHTEVTYYTLPNERVGALVRRVKITNNTKQTSSFEVLDGMPAVIPYGVNMGSMKEMGQTTKAWMQVEDVETKLPYFRVRVSMEDTASVQSVEGGNFAMAIDEESNTLPVIVDPEVVFAYDTTLDKAVAFQNGGLKQLLAMKQVKQNNLPCCFFTKSAILKSGESIEICEVIGQVENRKVLLKTVHNWTDINYFTEKRKEGLKLAESLCKVIDTNTGNEIFDQYCKQTYLDNVLRGGYPIQLSEDKIFYLYSRKHGDIERDYNYFRMLPEYYSQGNGNFRDVNQNRRCDVRFQPYVKDNNIKMFYNLIQIDGYNPLSVDMIHYSIDGKGTEKVLRLVEKQDHYKLKKVLDGEFTPGKLAMAAQTCTFVANENANTFMKEVLQYATEGINATFGEGYWSDHWTYNLDLVESYLSIFPDKEKELLFEDNTYVFFDTKVCLLPRHKRYVITDNGVRQYVFLDKESKKNEKHDLLLDNNGRGEVVTSTLIEKLLLLDTLKYTTLDPYGMGVEMEGGKPGWYDALNGLPGIFGSSMAETYELARMILFTVEKLKKYHQSVIVLSELANLIEQVDRITKEQMEAIRTQEQVYEFWDAINTAKETYRELTKYGVSGEKIALSNSYIVSVLQGWLEVIQIGITKAIKYGKELCPTYFSYEVTEYTKLEDGIIPTHFSIRLLPYFLEGPVHYLKIAEELEKKQVYDAVKTSELYDDKLQMYKVNASLENASYEIGRCKAFTPGWLENGSIWLHMEYKYLLELLKSGLYTEFFQDFHKACVPFLDANRYGRSLLENSSFLASSVNPNEKIHGKGFVARLSGSTAEFMSMWQIMMFGENPFVVVNEELRLELRPTIPSYLIDDKCVVKAMFLGKTQIVYHVKGQKDVIPERNTIQSMEVTWMDGSTQSIRQSYLNGMEANRVRNQEAIRIEIILN